MRLKIFMVIALLILLPTVAVMASDITGAHYLTTIRITNTGSPATNVAANFTLSTPGMYAAGMLNNTATDASIIDGSDIDMAFMPGYDTNPWITFVSSIGSNTTQNEYLYSASAVDGKIVYYPGTTGMTVVDDASLELGNNFMVIVKGWFDTTAGPDKYLVDKGSDLRIYVSPTESGNITAEVSDGATTTYLSIAGIDSGEHEIALVSNGIGLYLADFNGWDTFYDYTYGASGGSTEGWSWQCFTPSDSHQMDTIKIFMNDTGLESPVSCNFTIGIYTAPANVPDELLYSVNFTAAALTAVDYDDYSLNNYSLKWIDITPNIPVVADTQYAIKATTSTYPPAFIWAITQLDGPFTDGLLRARWQEYLPNVQANAVTINDNSNAWLFVPDSATLYMEDAEVMVGNFYHPEYDEQRGYWQWEYGDTFSDWSGYGNTATPTFRTTGLNAEVVSQEPVSAIPSGNATGGWIMIPTVPGEPAGLFTTGTGSFPGRGELEALATANRIPVNAVLTFVAFGTAILAFVLVFAFTHRNDKGIRGSLLFASLTSFGVLIYWYKAGGGVIPGWTLIPVGVSIVLLLLWRNPNTTPI